jgi:CheY-like chemotaxis protein
MPGDDDLLFGDDDPIPVANGPRASRNLRPWNVLIVDDEEQVHAVTRMVLDDFEFKQIPLNFMSGYSAAEGREILSNNDDIAVCLLDVVMETDNAGLELARWVRENLGNPWLRIILRTGQPGQAPERKVIVEYDINDYKEKSELTAQKLFSAMITALRSYKDIMAIESSRRGLEKIIDASASLFQIRSMERFLSGILIQLGSLLEMSVDSVLISASIDQGGHADDETEYRVVAASGRFAGAINGRASDMLEDDVWREMRFVITSRQSIYQTDYSIVFFHSRTDRVTVLYMETKAQLRDIDHDLIKLFCRNASVGLDNLAV